MASMQTQTSARRARRSAGVCLLAVALAAPAFVSLSASARPALPRSAHTAVYAEEKAAQPASVALVKVTEQNSITTAGVLGGIAGLLLGGVWVGGALFVAGSYIARKKDDDVAAALKGVASGSLEALNFVGYLSDKYTVTDKIGSALGDAVKNAKSDAGNKETVSTVTGALDQVGEAIAAFDKDVGIKDTLGSLLMAAGDLAAQAVDKAIELNNEYKVTDQIKAKIDEAAKAK